MLFEVQVPLVNSTFEDVRATAAECGLSALMICERVSVFGDVESLERFSTLISFDWSFPGFKKVFHSSDLSHSLMLRMQSAVRVCCRPRVDGIPDQSWGYAFGGVASR